MSSGQITGQSAALNLHHFKRFNSDGTLYIHPIFGWRAKQSNKTASSCMTSSHFFSHCNNLALPARLPIHSILWCKRTTTVICQELSMSIPMNEPPDPRGACSPGRKHYSASSSTSNSSLMTLSNSALLPWSPHLLSTQTVSHYNAVVHHIITISNYKDNPLWLWHQLESEHCPAQSSMSISTIMHKLFYPHSSAIHTDSIRPQDQSCSSMT